MRFMILVKASKDSEAGVLPDESMIAKMVTYHEELQKAGALVDASGLQRSAKGWRINYSGGKRTFIEALTETKSWSPLHDHQYEVEEEAIEWTSVFNPATRSGETKCADVRREDLVERGD
jgi:hypothetical protein